MQPCKRVVRPGFPGGESKNNLLHKDLDPIPNYPGIWGLRRILLRDPMMYMYIYTYMYRLAKFKVYVWFPAEIMTGEYDKPPDGET